MIVAASGDPACADPGRGGARPEPVPGDVLRVALRQGGRLHRARRHGQAAAEKPRHGAHPRGGPRPPELKHGWPAGFARRETGVAASVRRVRRGQGCHLRVARCAQDLERNRR